LVEQGLSGAAIGKELDRLRAQAISQTNHT